MNKIPDYTDGEETLGLVKTRGEIKIRMVLIIIVGALCGLMIIAGTILSFGIPDKTKFIWEIIRSIIIPIFTGGVGFLAGEKSAG